MAKSSYKKDYLCSKFVQKEDRIRLLRDYAVNENLYENAAAKHFRHLLKESPYNLLDLHDGKRRKTQAADLEGIFRLTKKVCTFAHK